MYDLIIRMRKYCGNVQTAYRRSQGKERKERGMRETERRRMKKESEKIRT
jgi:hypothetical protein